MGTPSCDSRAVRASAQGRIFMSLGRSLLGSIAIPLLLTGCASTGNTLQQDRVWDAYAACKASRSVPTNIQIERVEPDGRYWYRTGDGSFGQQALQACMQEELAKWKASTPSRTLAVASPQPASALSVPPAWTPGDEWAFRYESPSGNGTFVWSVDREEAID